MRTVQLLQMSQTPALSITIIHSKRRPPARFLCTYPVKQPYSMHLLNYYVLFTKYAPTKFSKEHQRLRRYFKTARFEMLINDSSNQGAKHLYEKGLPVERT